MDREVEELPKTFNSTKREFEKWFTIYKGKNEVIEKEVKDTNNGLTITEEKRYYKTETWAELWLMIKELQEFLYKKESEVIEKLSEKFEEENITSICLPKYGRKVEFDKEANWYFDKEMDKSDWKAFDDKCNSEYIKKRNSK